MIKELLFSKNTITRSNDLLIKFSNELKKKEIEFEELTIKIFNLIRNLTNDKKI